MEFTPQQSKSLQLVESWLNTRNAPQIFRLFGFAGTGKTTIAKEVRNMVHGRVLFGAYTGKAALVLRTKDCYGAQTIHSMIYKPDEDEDGKPIFVLNPESPVRGAGLIIIDECSMVGDDLAKDLMSFGTRILVLGDPAQLPPVKGQGYFTNAEPDFMLTDIRRQELDNPIIKMSMDVREGRGVSVGQYGESKVIRRRDLQPGEVMAADQVLCGLNNTRRGLNYKFRDNLGYTETAPDFPHEGDRVVCLKNNKELQLYNGSLWAASGVTVKEVSTLKDGQPVKNRIISMGVVSADGTDARKNPTPVTVPVEFFHGTEENLPYWMKRGHEAFDFGYALTVHKSQGSQWNHVMVFDESYAFRENARQHLYTALTRAAERVTIVLGNGS